MKNQNRRTFIKNSILTGSAFAINNPVNFFGQDSIQPLKEIRIKEVDSNFEREPLIRPFGFKGGRRAFLCTTRTSGDVKGRGQDLY